MKTLFKKQIHNQRGQALFEMILFLPFLMFLYTIYYSAGNSINGSINQQKAVRGYLFTLIKGNSYINSYTELSDLKQRGLTKIGFNSVGWKEDLQGETPIAPCFRFSSLLKNGSTEKCEEKREEENSSRFIRLFTYYGICGPYYTFVDPDYWEAYPASQADATSCTIGN